MVKLSVVIVMFNEFELVQTALASIYKQGIKGMEVILSDNSIDKKGHEKVIKKFPNVVYLQNKKDLGFAAGVNAGLKIAKGDYYLIFTPDMFLLPGTIKKTLEYIEKNPMVGLVGSRIMQSSKKQEQSVLKSYPNLISLLYYYNMPFYKLLNRFFREIHPMYYSLKSHKKIIIAKAVSGQYMLIRKKAIDEIGKFDSKFFLYFEDIDFCKRLNDAGWQVVYLPFGGAVQNGISDWKENIRITQSISYYMKSLYRFYSKHHGPNYARFAWLVGCFSALISVPYLYFVSRLKTILGHSSQAFSLLPIWIKIVNWHIKKGARQVF